MNKIAVYGAGGFGKEVVCILNKINEKEKTWDFTGFFDDGLPKGKTISRFGKVLGNIDDLNTWPEQLAIAFAIGKPKTLKLLTERITNPLITYPNIIHPEAFLADSESLGMGKGNVITRGSSFSCDVTVGDFNQFNSISALAHDVTVGSFNVFMPLARISGEVVIGDLNFFGIGAIVLQQVKIGSNTRIAAGSVLMTKTKDGFLYMGNPARKTDL
jgi:sugar O-acyltransferase (sialic acid O-acetyltransferase NeuD family)